MPFLSRFRRADVPEHTDPQAQSSDQAAEADQAVDSAEATAELNLAVTDEEPEAPAAESAEEPETGDEAAAAEPRRNRRRVLLGAAAATVLLLGGAGAVVAGAHKSVKIDLDGQTYTLSTFAGSVGGVLDEAGIAIGPHDEVVPGASEQLSDGADVVVRTGEQISIVTDGEEGQIWTTALTAGEALSQLMGSGRDVSLQASRSSDGREQIDLPLVTDGPVTLVADGDERTLEIRGSATLAEVLLRAEVEVGANDETHVTAAANGDPVVTVIRHTTETRTRTRPIENESVQRGTDDLYEGQSRVAEEGSDGERTITVQDHLVDGEVESTKVLSNEVTTEPVNRVVEVGTAERPPPEPTREPSSSGSGSSGSSSSDSGSSDDSGSGSDSDSGSSDSGSSGSGGSAGSGVWAALAQCESGGNPRAVSGSGSYYGLYQFSVGTWQSVGGSGLPSEASPAEQTQRAQALQARSGWGQWPYCSSQLGLR